MRNLAIAIAITLLSLAACSPGVEMQPLAPDTTVLAFGDSVTFGTGARPGEDYPTLLARETGWRLVNAGIPGDTAQAARGRIDTLLARHQPGLVIVELGGNDFLRRRSEDLVEQDLLDIVGRIQARGTPVVLIAVPRLSLLRATLGAPADSPLYARVAEMSGALLVEDIFSAVLGDESLKADPIHPNADGYRAFTRGLLEALREAGLLNPA